MQKLLIFSVLIVLVVGITTRHHLNKIKAQMDEDTDEVPLSQSLRDSGNQASLSKAFNQVMAPPQPKTPVAAAPAAPQNKGIADQVEVFIKQIQDSNQDSPYALEKALALTAAPEHESYRLTVLQAAMALQGDDNIVRNAMMGVATGTNVQSPVDREVVSTAYKVYLQVSVDSTVAFNDTMQILNSQSDTELKSKITADCINKYPQLRERFQ